MYQVLHTAQGVQAVDSVYSILRQRTPSMTISRSTDQQKINDRQVNLAHTFEDIQHDHPVCQSLARCTPSHAKGVFVFPPHFEHTRDKKRSSALRHDNTATDKTTIFFSEVVLTTA